MQYRVKVSESMFVLLLAFSLAIEYNREKIGINIVPGVTRYETDPYKSR